MSEVAIRALTPADVERVGAIWLAASLQAHEFVDPAFWRADHAVMVGEILPGASGFVATRGDELVGFVTVGVRDGSPSIGCLFVDPPQQGRGVGSALLGHVQARHDRLRLTVYEQNAGARRFYARHGFLDTETGRCEHTGCPELVMKWDAPRAV